MSEFTRLEIDDLADLAVELSDEELQAVSGARPSISDCGSNMRADDWIY
jgi:hypothetical protein